MNQIAAKKKSYSEHIDQHAHSHAQLIMPIRGKLYLHLGQQKQLAAVDQQSLYYIPPYCNHCFYSEGSNEFLVIDIPEVLLDSKAFIHQNDGRAFPLTSRWSAIRHLVLTELDCAAEEETTDLNVLYPYIEKCLTSGQKPKSIQYIHNHFDKLNNRLSIKELANIEHYNRSYYSEWFLKVTGSTPAVYVQKLRVNKAKLLLCQTSLSIADIAYQTGLEHQASLTRLFRQHVQLSPSQYRKMHRPTNG